ncbi:MAG: hypothetical protein ACPGLV_14720 [Bacteroidia bacterium]
MKNLILIVAVSLFTTTLFAQKNGDMNTLINSKTRIGAYVSIENQYKDFNSSFPGIYSGARVGFIFNRNLFVGFGAYGLTNEININDVFESGDEFEIESGYGGLSIEYVLFPKRAVHLSFPCMLGVGGASIRESGFGLNRTYDDDIFWHYQAGANVELNLTKWMRVSGGVYFTEAQYFELAGVSNTMFDGLSYGMSLKLGRF